MLHKMKLAARPFEMIADESKTIELRLNDEKRQQVAVGDEIEFTHLTKPIVKQTVQVKALHHFASFAALYQQLPLLECGYTPDSLASASPSDMEAYYTLEQQAQYGVLGIEISRIN